jgi:molybdopterin converting factor small subunit
LNLVRIKVKIWSIPDLQTALGGAKEVEIDLDGQTVSDLTGHLFGRIGPEARGFYLNDRGEIIRALTVVVNGKALMGLDKFAQVLKDGDTVEVAPVPG